MKERPILFSGPMVRAILGEKKTQTRRIVNPQPSLILLPGTCAVQYGPRHVDFYTHDRAGQAQGSCLESAVCRHGQPGDQLRVKLTLTLEIIAVRVERLRDISEADAEAEGCKDWLEPWRPGSLAAKVLYSQLWESIHGPGSWALNPWVWVIEFKIIEKELAK